MPDFMSFLIFHSPRHVADLPTGTGDPPFKTAVCVHLARGRLPGRLEGHFTLLPPAPIRSYKPATETRPTCRPGAGPYHNHIPAGIAPEYCRYLNFTDSAEAGANVHQDQIRSNLLRFAVEPAPRYAYKRAMRNALSAMFSTGSGEAVGASGTAIRRAGASRRDATSRRRGR